MNPSPNLFRPAMRSLPPFRAFTLIEILVVVSIIAVLAALIFPSVSNMQVAAKQANCVSNLRTISNGFTLFLGDNNNVYPGNGPSSTSGQSGSKYFRWMHRVGPYMDLSGNITTRSALGSPFVETLDTGYTEKIFHCPTTPPKFYQGTHPPIESLGIYGYNSNIHNNPDDTTKTTGVNALSVERPAATVLLADRFSGGGSRPEDEGSVGGGGLLASRPYPAGTTGASANHRKDRDPAADPLGAGMCNFLFVDGHVESLDLEKMRPWVDKAGNKTGITFKLSAP